MPPAWNITGWAITQEARTFPDTDGHGLRVCIQPPEDQKSIYVPLIEDYIARNKKKLSLKRQFELPEFALVGPTETKAIQERWPPHTNSSNSGEVPVCPFNATVIFRVSAVGFNSDRTRALVYVGHSCGGLVVAARIISWSRRMATGKLIESTVVVAVRGRHRFSKNFLTVQRSGHR
jgi:hypothetical protein